MPTREPPRTLGEIRADVLADLLLTTTPTGHHDAAGDALTGIRGQVNITIPLTTAAGLDEEPALLSGYGPVDTDLARCLLAKAPAWNLVLVNISTGAPVAVTRYRPSAELQRFVDLRDERCRFPGCTMKPWRCDTDHTIDAALGGETSACNLADLCRRHHVLKHCLALAGRTSQRRQTPMDQPHRPRLQRPHPGHPPIRPHPRSGPRRRPTTLLTPGVRGYGADRRASTPDPAANRRGRPGESSPWATRPRTPSRDGELTALRGARRTATRCRDRKVSINRTRAVSVTNHSVHTGSSPDATAVRARRPCTRRRPCASSAAAGGPQPRQEPAGHDVGVAHAGRSRAPTIRVRAET